MIGRWRMVEKAVSSNRTGVWHIAHHEYT